MSALSAKSLLVGGGSVLLLGLAGLGVHVHELREQNRALALRATAADREDAARQNLAALRRDNQDLRARLAALENERRDDAAREAEPVATAANARTMSPEDVERLFAEATAALDAHDRARFSAAFLALIDAGEAAHAALVEFLAATGGSYNHIYHLLEGEDADYAFRRELNDAITARRAALSGLLDAILSRPGEIDGATLFAFDLMAYNRVESARPREAQLRAVLDVLSTALAAEEPGVAWNDYSLEALQALGRLGASEVLPELERLLADPAVSDRNKRALGQAIAEIGGEDGVAALERFRASAGVPLRESILRNLASHGGPEIGAFLEESLAREEDPGIREGLLRALSQRSRFREQLFERLESGELDGRERLTVLESLFESEDEAHRAKAWEHFDTLPPEARDEIVAALAGRDARATEILFERLQEETFSDELVRGVLQLDSRVVHDRAATLRAVAADTSATLHARGAAAGALARVDPQGSVSALLTGFEQLPERERRSVVDSLADFVRGSEARAAIDRIAATDPAPVVREAAERARSR